ncbi:response regulator transcription factor [Hydrogenovibrio sp. JE_KL2]|uniref:response regulator transcription factor n=1 Tax=Hydrogenovibrio sp. JE_KL2 TaxID=2651188 RepID=UPI001C12A79B|nr:response regulator transcription factor [Hydrogenovibrio sp. JE_KL2]
MFKKVLVLEDRQEHLEFLRQALENICSDVEILTAKNIQEARQKLSKDIELYILDLELPDGAGIELIPLIRGLRSSAKVMVFTVFDEDDTFFKAMRMGIDGYVLKTETQQGLVDAINDVYKGMAALSPALARKLMNFHAASYEALPELSDKETAVLKLIAQGHTMKSAAEHLNRSIDTVKFHVKEIYRKTGAQNRSELLRLAREMGIS